MPIGCYVINLDRSPERLEHFCLQAAREGVDFRRISAVDGSRLDKSAKDRLLSMSSGRLSLSPGQMGCYLSHRKAWTILLDDGFDYGFIAEDDVYLANAYPFLRTAKWLPTHFDLIKAETTHQVCEFFADAHSTFSGHSLRRPKSYHFGTAGYFIARHGAVKLLRATENLCDAIDDIMFDNRLGVAQSLTIYQLDPAICVQHQFARHASQQIRLRGTIESGKLLSKPEGIAKVWRELSRPFVRFGNRLEREIKSRRGISIFKRVGFAGDDQQFPPRNNR